MGIKYGAPTGLGSVSLSASTIQFLNSGAVGKNDISVELSTWDGWLDIDGASMAPILIPFTDLHTRIENTTGGTKVLLVHFLSTQIASAVGLGCTSGSFKNVKIDLLGSGLVERTVIDLSGDSTPETSKLYRFPEQYFNAVRISFVTPDPVCISNIIIKAEKPVSISQRDYTTDALSTIDHAHEEIHSGKHFSHRDFHTVLKNTNKDHLIIVPDTTMWPHFIAGIEALSDILQVRFYEGPTWSALGSLETGRNRNRNSLIVPTMQIYEDPTITTTGLLLYSFVLGSGKNSSGGSLRDAREMVLRQNTAYLLRVTEPNVVPTSTQMNLDLDWYEHSNLNRL